MCMSPCFHRATCSGRVPCSSSASGRAPLFSSSSTHRRLLWKQAYHSAVRPMSAVASASPRVISMLPSVCALSVSRQRIIACGMSMTRTALGAGGEGGRGGGGGGKLAAGGGDGGRSSIAAASSSHTSSGLFFSGCDASDASTAVGGGGQGVGTASGVAGSTITSGAAGLCWRMCTSNLRSSLNSSSLCLSWWMKKRASSS